MTIVSRVVSVAVVALFAASAGSESPPRYPFPQNLTYYEDSVTLLGLLVMSGNFWDPTLMFPRVSAPRRVTGRAAP